MSLVCHFVSTGHSKPTSEHTVLDLDPHRDTPVEIPHTWLLGVVKYVWHMLHTTWSDAQKNIFTIQLQDIDINGLSIPPIYAGYMVAYRNNLIRKYFKSIQQTIAFKIYGLVGPKMCALVRTLSAML